MQPPDGLEQGFPLARLTTIGTGGAARWFARPTTMETLAEALRFAEAEQLDVAVVGLGSNLLVADAGFDGLVVRLDGALSAIELDGARAICGGGASLAALVRRATDAGLSGIEFGCAIPGTVGGAVRMNAGAYGGELRDVLVEAVVVSASGVRRDGPAGLEMTYRHSNVVRGEVVAAATLQLAAAPVEEIRTRVREMQARRAAAQPRKARTFGSVFKNPDEGPGAGQLLEACALKGYAIGGARISLGPRELHRERRDCDLGGRRRADRRGEATRTRALRCRPRARGRAAGRDRDSIERMRRSRAEPRRVAATRVTVVRCAPGRASPSWSSGCSRCAPSAPRSAIGRCATRASSPSTRSSSRAPIRASPRRSRRPSARPSAVARCSRSAPARSHAPSSRFPASTSRASIGTSRPRSACGCGPSTPVAIAVSGHDRVLVSSTGRVLATIGRRSRPPDLPRVGLPGHGVPHPGAYIENRQVLDTDHRGRVDPRLTSEHSWDGFARIRRAGCTCSCTGRRCRSASAPPSIWGRSSERRRWCCVPTRR